MLIKINKLKSRRLRLTKKLFIINMVKMIFQDKLINEFIIEEY